MGVASPGAPASAATKVPFDRLVQLPLLQALRRANESIYQWIDAHRSSYSCPHTGSTYKMEQRILFWKFRAEMITPLTLPAAPF